METLAAQPTYVEYDRQQRARNDAETWLAEVLDGSMRTPFEYSFDGHELYADDGSALGPIFHDSIIDAKRISVETPALSFELRRRSVELGEYEAMLAMCRGELPNTMIVVSDFPAELMNAAEDVGGYNVTRKQTMLRVLSVSSGKLMMHSQTLDGSDRQALEAIYVDCDAVPQDGELLGQRIHIDVHPEDQSMMTDRLTGIYDRHLTRQHGGEWYAGRPEANRDTYSFVRRQHQLINRFVTAELSGGASDWDKYNMAALMTKRFAEARQAGEYAFDDDAVIQQFMGGVMTQSLDWELQRAGDEARDAGTTFSGCGASAKATSTEQQLTEAGYGNQSESSEASTGKKHMSCPFCTAKVYDDPCARVLKCYDCKAKVVDGQVVSKGDGGSKARTKKQKAAQFALAA